jgi:hypothetical protein
MSYRREVGGGGRELRQPRVGVDDFHQSAAARGAADQGLTLVHCLAQLEPFSSLTC